MIFKKIKFTCNSIFLLLISITINLFLVKGISGNEPIEASKYLIGVHPERIHNYEIKSGNFNCLDGSGSIPFELVNDDYCDCRDASDEPGTAACPHGRFFCKNKGYIQRLIPSAWVNDGQCDCCDTSDEYNSTVTCENTCGALGEVYRQEQERYREIADQGSAIRSQYKEQAKLRKEQNQQLLEQYKRELSDKENAIKRLEEELNSDFGPANVFFPLKGKCYNYKDREYTYTLCPFERATQESTSGMQTELGRWTGWTGPQDNVYSKQKYEGGLTCWNGPARSALVNIECGVEDKITSVIEPAKCEYVYNFITPAACPDLDPPEQQQTAQESTEQQQFEGTSVETPPSLEVEGEESSEHEGYYEQDHQKSGEEELTPNGGDVHDEL